MSHAPADYAALVADLTSASSPSGLTPDAPAVVDRRGVQSRGQLGARVLRLAAGLSAEGVTPGDVVALWLPNRREWVETALAVGLLGAVTLGLNTRLGSHDVGELLDRSGAALLVVDPDVAGPALEDVLQGPAGRRRVVDPTAYAALLRAAPLEPSTGLDPQRPVQAFTSSGSTGTPKLVLHSPHGLLFHAAANARTYGLTADGSAALVSLPLCGVFGFNAALAALVAGRVAVLQESFDAIEAVDLIERHGVTHLSASDTMLERLCQAVDDRGDGSAPTWRQAAFGNFTPGDCTQLVARGDAQGRFFFQTYGSSEVLSTLTYPAHDADHTRRAQGGGVPIHPEVVLDIRDDEGRPLPVGQEGQLWVGGPTVCLGYLSQGRVQPPALSADGLIATGDVGVRLNDRDVVYRGRLGDAVRIGGFLFSPAEVEAYVDTLDGVERSAYVVVEEQGRLQGVAFVTARAGAQLDTSALEQRARAELAPFKVPRAWSVIDQLPLIAGANGDKIDRRSLAALAREVLRAPSDSGGAR